MTIDNVGRKEEVGSGAKAMRTTKTNLNGSGLTANKIGDGLGYSPAKAVDRPLPRRRRRMPKRK